MKINSIISILIILVVIIFAFYFMQTGSKLAELKAAEKNLPKTEYHKDDIIQRLKPEKADSRDYDFIMKYIGTTFDPSGKLYPKVEEAVKEEQTKYATITIIIVFVGIVIMLAIKKIPK